jgi:Putative transposase
VVVRPLEFIARIAALIPPPRQHRHRYYGVLVPNAPQRRQVTPAVMSGAAITEGDSTAELAPADPTIGTDGNAARQLSCQLSCQLSRYSWAKLIARVFETDPLQCGRCGGRMKIIGEGRRKVIYEITRRLANGKRMPRIQTQPIKTSRCIGKR